MATAQLCRCTSSSTSAARATIVAAGTDSLRRRLSADGYATTVHSARLSPLASCQPTTVTAAERAASQPPPRFRPSSSLGFPTLRSWSTPSRLLVVTVVGGACGSVGISLAKRVDATRARRRGSAVMVTALGCRRTSCSMRPSRGAVVHLESGCVWRCRSSTPRPVLAMSRSGLFMTSALLMLLLWWAIALFRIVSVS